MTKQKTYTVKISRDFMYEYEVKANNEDDAIQKAYDDWEGETDDVELIEEYYLLLSRYRLLQKVFQECHHYLVREISS